VRRTTVNYGYTKNEFTRYLNEIGVPEEEKEVNGGRVPRTSKLWGNWLKKHDPIAFNVAYQEELRRRGLF
jgi:hypothetical protein